MEDSTKRCFQNQILEEEVFTSEKIPDLAFMPPTVTRSIHSPTPRLVLCCHGSVNSAKLGVVI